MRTSAFILLAIGGTSVGAFAPTLNKPCKSSTSLEASRRDVLQTVTSAGVTALSSLLAVQVQPASAEVAAGTSLPQGALQFSRLVRLKSDLLAVTKRVSEHPEELDKKEWDNLSDFLRILYKGSDDMKAITKASIYDPEKKKKAEEDIKFIQKVSQLGDGPVSKQDAEGLVKILQKSSIVIEDFFELLRDVPDEL